MSAEMPVPTVRLIIRDDRRRVLILRRPENSHGAGGWCLPGGKVDFNDTVENTVDKELHEETELECIKKRFLFYQDSLPNEYSEMHIINFYFECEIEGEININDESSEFAWISKEELKNHAMVFKNDEALQRFWKSS